MTAVVSILEGLERQATAGALLSTAELATAMRSSIAALRTHCPAVPRDKVA